jgi:aminoglycoside phosphotransferase (APT) family kinase protein
MSVSSQSNDVVDTVEQAAAMAQEPHLILEPLAGYLDAAGLGSGRIDAVPIGAGHSNVTYALSRGEDRFVLRRPPRGPLAKSAHDVLREARLQRALGNTRVRVPDVLAICDDESVIGAPFYVMGFIDGHVLERELPPALAASDSGETIANQLIDALVELHAIDATAPELSGFGRPTGYLERQLRRFRQLRSAHATRPLPELEETADWLEANLPTSPEVTVVHGDYRLGNVMLTPERPPRIVALLDWEMATVGDPLADLGYMTAMWAEAGDPRDPMLELSEVTRLPGFPRRDELARRYADITGRDLTHLRWYQTLALWKACIFLEGSYGRYVAGTTSDPYFARLADGVPNLARRALRQAA